MPKGALRQDVMDAAGHPGCEQSPVLGRIVDHLERLDEHAKDTKAFQKEMVQVMKTQSAQTERLVAIADKTERNRDDIAKTEKRLNYHILSPGHSPVGRTDSDSKAKKWDKLTTSLIIGAILGAGSFIWKLIEMRITP